MRVGVVEVGLTIYVDDLGSGVELGCYGSGSTTFMFSGAAFRTNVLVNVLLPSERTMTLSLDDQKTRADQTRHDKKQRKILKKNTSLVSLGVLLPRSYQTLPSIYS
jgi:hypothetical protein